MGNDMEARCHGETNVAQETTSDQQSLQERLRKAEEDLKEKQKEADDLRRSWKQAVSELDRLVREGQAFNQMADDEVIDKTAELRFNITSFAQQHFGERIKYNDNVYRESSCLIKQYLQISPKKLKVYIQSPSSRHALIRAYLWRVLCNDIFAHYRWAPYYESKGMNKMCQLLEPRSHNKNTISEDDMRKFHMWRVTTSTLLSEALQPRKGPGKSSKFVKHLIQRICKSLTPLSTSKSQEITDRVTAIVNESTELDKQLSKQVASVGWCFTENGSTSTFNPETMEVDKGQKQACKDQKVELVLAPQLVKRGKSSGDGFGVRQTLLKMQVTCEAPTQGNDERCRIQ